MMRTSNILFLYQAFVAVWMLIFGAVSLATTWALLSRQASDDWKRPGIDLHKL